MSVDPPLHIGTLAHQSGVSVRAVRHYEQLGLLHPARASSGYRLFVTSDLQRVALIRHLQSLGLTLVQIRDTAPCWRSTPAHLEGIPDTARRALFMDQLNQLDAQIAPLQAARRAVLKALEETTCTSN